MPIGRKCPRFANLARIPSSSTTAGRLRGIFNSEDIMRLIVIFSLLLSATTAIAAPAEKKARTAEQACQAQALASIARQWPNVVQGYFEIIIKGDRCLVFLETPGVFAGKRVARLIDGKTGICCPSSTVQKTPGSAVAAAIAEANFRPANAPGMNIWLKPSRCRVTLRRSRRARRKS